MWQKLGVGHQDRLQENKMLLFLKILAAAIICLHYRLSSLMQIEHLMWNLSRWGAYLVLWGFGKSLNSGLQCSIC